jgi:hypothetical protein
MTNASDPPGIGEPSEGVRAERSPRPGVMLNALVERFDGRQPTRHRVRDLSTGGMRIDQATDLRAGSTILVTVGALEAIGATVIWVKGGSAGLKFAHAIDPDHARSKAAIAPRPTAPKVAGAPTAGWTYDVRNPYIKDRR